MISPFYAIIKRLLYLG